MAVKIELVGGQHDGKLMTLVQAVDRLRLTDEGTLFDYDWIENREVRPPVSCYHRRDSGVVGGRWLYDFHGSI